MNESTSISFRKHLIIVLVFFFSSSLISNAKETFFNQFKQRIDSITQILKNNCNSTLEDGFYFFKEKGQDPTSNSFAFCRSTDSNKVMLGSGVGYCFYPNKRDGKMYAEKNTGIALTNENGMWWLSVITPSNEIIRYLLSEPLQPHIFLTREWPYDLREYGRPILAFYYPEGPNSQPLRGVEIIYNGKSQYIFKADYDTYYTLNKKKVNLNSTHIGNWNLASSEADASINSLLLAYRREMEKQKPRTVVTNQASADRINKESFIGKDEIIRRHKQILSSLGTVTSKTTSSYHNSSKPSVEIDHYSSNVRVCKAKDGEAIFNEPMGTSKLHGGQIVQTNAVIKEGLPKSLIYNLKTETGTVVVAEQDNCLYFYYPSGNIFKVKNPIGRGTERFFLLAWGDGVQPFKINRENLTSNVGSVGTFKIKDKVLVLIFPEAKESYGWENKAREMAFGIDHSNGDLYDVNLETGNATVVGKYAEGVFIRVPEGLEFKSLVNDRVEFTNGSYMVYNSEDGYPKLDKQNLNLRFNNLLMESGDKMIFELDGQEVEARGGIEIPWIAKEDPLNYITGAYLYDMNGQQFDNIVNGRNKAQRQLDEAAADKANKAAVEKKMNQLRAKYGTAFANAALDGNLSIGMPIALLQDVPEWFTLRIESKSRTNTWYYVYKKVYSKMGVYSDKYAYISVSDGKIDYIDYCK